MGRSRSSRAPQNFSTEKNIRSPITTTVFCSCRKMSWAVPFESFFIATKTFRWSQLTRPTPREHMRGRQTCSIAKFDPLPLRIPRGHSDGVCVWSDLQSAARTGRILSDQKQLRQGHGQGHQRVTTVSTDKATRGRAPETSVATHHLLLRCIVDLIPLQRERLHLYTITRYNSDLYGIPGVNVPLPCCYEGLLH